MNRQINLCLFIAIMFILGGLFSKEYGVYMKRQGIKEAETNCTITPPQPEPTPEPTPVDLTNFDSVLG